MSDRINWLTVVLETDKRDDDCQAIIDAIRMIKGVSEVKPHIAEPRDYVAESRAKEELMQKLSSLLER